MREHRRQFYQELLRQKSAVIGASILIFFHHYRNLRPVGRNTRSPRRRCSVTSQRLVSGALLWNR